LLATIRSLLKKMLYNRFGRYGQAPAVFKDTGKHIIGIVLSAPGGKKPGYKTK